MKLILTSQNWLLEVSSRRGSALDWDCEASEEEEEEEEEEEDGHPVLLLLHEAEHHIIHVPETPISSKMYQIPQTDTKSGHLGHFSPAVR